MEQFLKLNLWVQFYHSNEILVNFDEEKGIEKFCIILFRKYQFRGIWFKAPQMGNVSEIFHIKGGKLENYLFMQSLFLKVDSLMIKEKRFFSPPHPPDSLKASHSQECKNALISQFWTQYHSCGYGHGHGLGLGHQVGQGVDYRVSHGVVGSIMGKVVSLVMVSWDT